jgi:hypothetical protein
VNILALISFILERLAEELAFGLKVAVFIGRLKNVCYAVIAVNLLLLLVDGVRYMLEVITLSSIMLDCGLKL